MLQTSSSELKNLDLFISILFKNTCSILLINHLSFFYPSVSQNVHHILLYLRIIIVLLFEKSNAWTFYLSHLFLRISKTCPIDYSFHLINLHFPTHGLLISSHLMYIQGSLFLKENFFYAIHQFTVSACINLMVVSKLFEI